MSKIEVLFRAAWYLSALLGALLALSKIGVLGAMPASLEFAFVLFCLIGLVLGGILVRDHFTGENKA